MAEAILGVLKTGVTGLGLGLIYGTVRMSMSSISKSSRESTEMSSFNRLYPSLRHHSDFAFVLGELDLFNMYASTKALLRSSEALMRKYVAFAALEKPTADCLLQYPKAVHDLGQAVKTAAQDLQTRLIGAKASIAGEVSANIQMVEKLVDEILFNVMMDVDVAVAEIKQA